LPKRYPAEFRRRVLDLVAEGRKVTDVAQDLGLSPQTIYSWRRQAEIDAGGRPGLRTAEAAELVAARRELRRLREENAILRRSSELLRDASSPKGGSRRSR
jgi:transposase